MDEKLLRELSSTKQEDRNRAYAVLRDHCLKLTKLVAWRANGISPEDITQTALTRIIRAGNCSNYNPAISSPKTFISAIIRRTYIDMLRAQGARINPEHLEDYATPNPYGHADYTNPEQNEILRAAVKGLGPPERNIVELAYFRGKSLSTVARSLDIPIGTVKSHLHKALVSLRKTVKDGRLEQALAA